MITEVRYFLFSEFNTLVEVPLIDFIFTLKSVKRRSLPHRVDVDKSNSSLWFVTLFS